MCVCVGGGGVGGGGGGGGGGVRACVAGLIASSFGDATVLLALSVMPKRVTNCTRETSGIFPDISSRALRAQGSVIIERWTASRFKVQGGGGGGVGESLCSWTYCLIFW